MDHALVLSVGPLGYMMTQPNVNLVIWNEFIYHVLRHHFRVYWKIWFWIFDLRAEVITTNRILKDGGTFFISFMEVHGYYIQVT